MGDSNGMWKSNGGVIVNLPNGTSKAFESATALDIKALAREAGVKKFHVKNEDGSAVEESAFPLTTGSVTIEEYNEAKASKLPIWYV